MAQEKECCGNCFYLYEEYGWLLCKRNENPMDDLRNEKCEDYERREEFDWEGGE